MKKITGFSLILFLVMWLMPLDVAADNTGGDVNNDGEVNIADVNTVINYILGDRSCQSIDVNGDGEVSIADVNAVIAIILKGTSTSEDHEYVNLGLPSGTLWATCNVGASAPEEYGKYFAWGETESKGYYEYSTYKWCQGSSTTLTKYCYNSNYGYNGYTDNKLELDTEDDAAYVNWGPTWRMPSKEQIIELQMKCSWKWTNQNGVNGMLVTGPNGASIFLPSGGSRLGSTLYHAGMVGGFWSRSLVDWTGIPYEAYSLWFADDGDYVDRYHRVIGANIRAVHINQN